MIRLLALPELWRRRAEHYYSEFARAEKGAELWRKGDLEGYGQLVFESGKSSIYSYECGCDELKKLYEIMVDTDGIYGGRFSGAGFKGCCMALIDPDKTEDIEARVTAEYLKAFPALDGKYSFHLCESADWFRSDDYDVRDCVCFVGCWIWGICQLRYRKIGFYAKPAFNPYSSNNIDHLEL